MTAYEEWLTNIVAVLLNNDGRFSAEVRAAVMLTQARALECRHLAAELIMKSGGAAPGTRVMAQAIAAQCTERSHKLEQLAMRFAQPDGWPIKMSTADPQEPEIIQ